MKILIVVLTIFLIPQKTYAHSGSVFKTVVSYLPAVLPFLAVIWNRIKAFKQNKRK